MTVKELKAEAKARGFKGYSRLRKSELEALLGKDEKKVAKTVKELRFEAKALGLKGYSRLSKKELEAVIAVLTSSQEVIDFEAVILDAAREIAAADPMRMFYRTDKLFDAVSDKMDHATFERECLKLRDSGKLGLHTGDARFYSTEEVSKWVYEQFTGTMTHRYGTFNVAA